MLQETEMVKSILESMYQDTCDVIEHHKVRKPDGAMAFEDVTVHSSIPCRLSFKSPSTTNNTESASAMYQQIEVFLAPDVEIKAGSKLVITHLGKASEYKNTGEPSVYKTHQEILLDIFKGWS